MKATNPHSCQASIGGETVTLYTASLVGRPIGKSTQTIRLLTQRGVLPDTPFRLRRTGSPSIRMYTPGMAEVVRDAFRHLGTSMIRPAAQAAFRDAVLAGWSRLGVVPPTGDADLIWV